MFTCLYVYMFTCLYVYMFTCLYVYMFIYPFIHSFVCFLFVCLNTISLSVVVIKCRNKKLVSKAPFLNLLNKL